MFGSFVFEKSAAAYTNRLMLIDTDRLENVTHYCAYFEERGFQIIRYEDDLHFRAKHSDVLENNEGKVLLLVQPGVYVPFDVIRRFKCVDVSISSLFPKLNATVVREDSSMNYDLLSTAYSRNYDDLRSPEQTMMFREAMYSYSTVHDFLTEKMGLLHHLVEGADDYTDWCRVSDLKAEIDTMATERNASFDTSFVNERFLSFVLSNFGKLSSVLDKDGPVLVSQAMEYMHDHSEKFAIIVMDGMSQFDWSIIRKSFDGINFEKTDVFAMIPTTTSISRQCLLSNKYPSQLIEPWKQSKEKTEFSACAKNMGYAPEQIGYERGYDADFPSAVKCAAVIINDVDDMVHGQKQGRIGMFNDITVLSKQGQLATLTRRLLRAGFDVYISADHGNTPCVGMGKLMKTGVEVETKSRRMLVLKDFADKDALLSQHNVFEYPKYYLNKAYDYLICDAGRSFDAKGEEVMSHGGITVDEVIVPFIKIKAVDNNG